MAIPPKSGIYKITNPKGKIYIGQTINLIKRWVYYKNLNCKNQIKLYNSLKKYGPESHKFEVIEECLIEKLDEKEVYWGLFYNVLEEGLNLRLGNIRGLCSQETKDKMSKSSLGVNNTQEHNNNISKARIGMEFTQITRNEMSKSKKNISKPNGFGEKLKKPHIWNMVLCIETGKIFKSAATASKEMKINDSFILKTCKGICKQAKGYTFKFVE
jgi:group I intron endonuclease